MWVLNTMTQKKKTPKLRSPTYEKRGTGFRNNINSLTTKNMAKDERQNQHHDLKKNSHSGSLLLLAGRSTGISRRNSILRGHFRKQKQFASTNLHRYCANRSLLGLVCGGISMNFFVLNPTSLRLLRPLNCQQTLLRSWTLLSLRQHEIE